MTLDEVMEKLTIGQRNHLSMYIATILSRRHSSPYINRQNMSMDDIATAFYKKYGAGK